MKIEYQDAAGGESMSWPDAIVTLGVVFAAAFVVFSICRWG
ncbi:hypothetical protein ACVHJS_004586 [Escherichia coli]|nr:MULTISPECIES: hypothetical protein [Escherichia]ERC87172.1 putative membrane protein [Escherichia coli T924_01]MCT2392864.1 hypothetical protein [Escherichia coli]MCV2956410.1 hypothetical protein [Escherichia coli]MCX3927183.1 hypothetical protein [Escherichia coli]MDC7889529.1 hypothetical protein [Escherichia coli]